MYILGNTLWVQPGLRMLWKLLKPVKKVAVPSRSCLINLKSSNEFLHPNFYRLRITCLHHLPQLDLITSTVISGIPIGDACLCKSVAFITMRLIILLFYFCPVMASPCKWLQLELKVRFLKVNVWTIRSAMSSERSEYFPFCEWIVIQRCNHKAFRRGCCTMLMNLIGLLKCWISWADLK